MFPALSTHSEKRANIAKVKKSGAQSGNCETLDSHLSKIFDITVSVRLGSRFPVKANAYQVAICQIHVELKHLQMSDIKTVQHSRMGNQVQVVIKKDSKDTEIKKASISKTQC